MTTAILMPRMPLSPAPATLTRWLVKEGDAVRAGDVVAEVAAGHLTMEVEASQHGVIRSLLVAAGTPGIAAATPIAMVAVSGKHGDDPGSGAHDEGDAPFADPPRASRSGLGESSSAEERASGGAPDEAAVMTYRAAIRATLVHEMHRDPSVVLIGRDVGAGAAPYSVAHGLADAFGSSRLVEMPRPLDTVAGIGIGAAMAGLRPVLTFPSWAAALPALERIVATAGIARYASAGRLAVPIVFRAPSGPMEQNGPQASMSLASWLAHVPGLKVVAPCSPGDGKGLLSAAIRDPDPVLILEHEALYDLEGPVPEGDAVIPLGRSRIVRAGGQATLVGYSRSVARALEAADRLAREGISVEVIDLTSLRPLDLDTVLASVRKTGRIVTIEEGWPVCSIGSEIVSRVVCDAFASLRAPPVQLAGADTPMPYAQALAARALPAADDAVAAIRRMIHGG